jgi:hypothetical protein
MTYRNMKTTNIYIPQIIYGVFCIFFAYANYVQITANDTVMHGINGALHLAVIVYFTFKIHWMLGLSMMFEARLLFDSALNLMRGLSVAYVPKNPKSVLDKVEKVIFFDNGYIPKIVYVLAIIILNIILWRKQQRN